MYNSIWLDEIEPIKNENKKKMNKKRKLKESVENNKKVKVNDDIKSGLKISSDFFKNTISHSQEFFKWLKETL